MEQVDEGVGGSVGGEQEHSLEIKFTLTERYSNEKAQMIVCGFWILQW